MDRFSSVFWVVLWLGIKSINMKQFYFVIFLFSLSSFSCTSQSKPVVKTGIEVLRESGFIYLEGKRVGLITNPTGVDSRLKSTIDILNDASNVNLVALFGPEHGVRGDVTAGEKISSSVDRETGIPVYSLYGKTKKPTKEMLKGLDILIYDIQDIGCRSYTFISTMGLAMEAAAENEIEFMVLDRPNPLGGNKVEGAIAQKEYFSIVGAYPIPYVYGLTVGELANYINKEVLSEKGKKCSLKIIPMKGWKRSMTFEDTALPWVLSSPHIPNAKTAYYYVATGILGELSIINNGVGYTLPFQLLGAEWIDAKKMSDAMNALKIEGVRFRPLVYKPYYTKWANKHLGGIQVYIENASKVNLMSIQFLFLQEHHKLYPDKDILDISTDRHNMFDKVCGSAKIRKSFFKNYLYSDIKDLIEIDNGKFQDKSKKYYIY